MKRKGLLKQTAYSPVKAKKPKEEELKAFKDQLTAWKKAERKRWIFVWVVASAVGAVFIYFWIQLIL